MIIIKFQVIKNWELSWVDEDMFAHVAFGIAL